MTMKKLKCAAAAALLAVAGSSALAADTVLLTENFDDLTALFTTSGWLKNNFSETAVGDGWFQGSGQVFAAHAGAADAFIASSVFIQATDAMGNPSGLADGLLRTGLVDMSGPTTMSFWTRTLTGNAYAESLYVGALVNGKDISLKAINDNLDVGVYPEAWTKYTVYLPGQGVKGTALAGRFYFEFYQADTAFAGNYIGVDSVVITSVPEPGTWLMMGLGVAALGGLRRRAAV